MQYFVYVSVLSIFTTRENSIKVTMIGLRNSKNFSYKKIKHKIKIIRNKWRFELVICRPYMDG